MSLTDRVSRIVAFVRAGYPTGTPNTGYVPLLALLPRRLTEDEITRITGKLVRLIGFRHGPVDNVDVGVEITQVTDQMPSTDDIDRVQRHVAAIVGSAGRHE